MISAFTPAIFWDTDIDELNISTHSGYSIERVLNYGTLRDWRLLKQTYTPDKLRSISLGLRNLDPKTLSFLSNYFNIPKTSFCSYSPG